MTTEQLLEKLTDAAERCGLAVRTEKGNFDGGRCRMAGKEVVMLNERDLPERRLAVLARAFRPEELEAVYLPPVVRNALDEARADAQPGNAQPGNAQPGNAQPGNAQPGNAQPGNAQPGNAQTGEEAPAHAE